MRATVIKRVHARKGPSTGADKVCIKEVGENLQIKSVLQGEAYRGSSLWYLTGEGHNLTSLALSLTLEGNMLGNILDFPSMWQLAVSKPLKIGLYDSGVSQDADLFGNRVIQMNSHQSGVNRHADYMATIIAGQDVKNGYYGFIPNAQILSYQSDITTDEQSHSIPIIGADSFIDALTKFETAGVDMINISMSTQRLNDFFQSTRVRELLSELTQKGILVIASTGDDDFKNDNVKNYPAALESIISVSGFQSSGSQLDCAFHVNIWSGVNILAPTNPVYNDSFFKKLQFFETAGSSAPCAIITGALGILKLHYEKVKPGVSLFQYIHDFLQSMPTIEIDSIFLNSKNYNVFDLNQFKNRLNQLP